MATPTVLQMEALECGAAALAMVLAHYGRWLPLEDLRADCGVSRDGSRAGNILRAARAHGMSAKGLRVEPASLGAVTLPAILFWEFNHFVVLEGFGPKGVYLNDPARGQRVVAWDGFDRSFTGLVLAMEPTDRFETGGSRPSVAKALAARFERGKAPLVLCVLAGLGLLVPGLLIPAAVREFVNQYLGAGNRSWLWLLVIGVGTAAVVQMAFTWLQQITLLRLSTRMSMSMSTKFFDHALRLPLAFFSQRFTGDVVNRIGLNDEVASLLSSQLAATLLGMLTAIFYLALMAVWDWQLTLVAVLFAGGNIAALTLGDRRQRVLSEQVVQENGKLISTAAIGLMNIEAMKASSEDASFFARWAGQQAKLVTATQEIAFNGAMITSVPLPLAALNMAVLLGFGGWQVMHGNLSLGTLVAFQMLVGGFNGPVGQLIGFGQTLRQASGNLRSIDDVMRYPEDPDTPPLAPSTPTAVAILLPASARAERVGPPAAPAPPRRMEFADLPARLSGAVELVDVTFGYDPLGSPLIKGLCLRVEPGERVAIVGRTGSGKSTVAKLVAGLNHPWSGQVLIDGITRDAIPRLVLANTVALVDQDIRLFEGTVRDNLTLWDGTVPEQAIVQAARDARIHDDIARRPGGYDRTILEGGADWSGGQRQRLEIARALTGAPSVLVLDEATAALDPLVEAQIDQALRARGLTCLIVAHRLSTIRDCDEIIVLDQGSVAERGRHEDLMAAGGIYASLAGG